MDFKTFLWNFSRRIQNSVNLGFRNSLISALLFERKDANKSFCLFTVGNNLYGFSYYLLV